MRKLKFYTFVLRKTETIKKGHVAAHFLTQPLLFIAC